MNRSLQADRHPEADSLSAFAERALSEAEQGRIVAHLARCVRCRDIVFLAQAAAEAESAVVEATGRGMNPIAASPLPGQTLPAAARKDRVGFRIPGLWPMPVGSLALIIPAAALAAGAALVFWVEKPSPEPPSQQALSAAPSSADASASREAVQSRPGSLDGNSASGPNRATGNPDRPAASMEIDSAKRAGAPERASASLMDQHLVQTAKATAAAPLDRATSLEGPVPAAPPARRNFAPIQLGSSPGPSLQPSLRSALQPSLRSALRSLPNAGASPAPGASPLPTLAEARTAPPSPPAALANTAWQQPALSAMSVNLPGPDEPASPAGPKWTGQSLHGSESAEAASLAAAALPTRRALFAGSLALKSQEIPSRFLLPSGLLSVATAALQARILAVDPHGVLFLSNDAGKVWATVTPPWKGRIIGLFTNPPAPLGLTAGQDADAPAGRSAATESNPSGQQAAPVASGASGQNAAPLTPTLLFRIVTDGNETWVSSDGENWHKS